ncbi:MAG: FxsA family protein [Longimicrobiales bacterium]
MNVLGGLALLFIVVPILELVILIRLGQFMGLWPTLALVLAAGFLGAALARFEGTRVLLKFQSELAAGRLPTQAAMDGICVMIGGVMLLTPGVLTDLVGLALLFPPTRRGIQWWVRKRLEKGMAEGSIRVMSMGPQGFGTWGGVGTPPSPTGTPPGLDPSKGIVIEEDDSRGA